MTERIHIDAIDALRATGRLEKILARPKPFLHIIAEELYRVGRQSFESEADPEGKRWHPLSLRYARWKSKRFPGRGILRLRGQLVRSLRRGITDRTAWVTAGPLKHAAVHQYGFDGTVQVPAHVRRLKSTRKRKYKKTTCQVRSFSRRMRILARPYLGFPISSEKQVIADIEQLIPIEFNGGKP